MTSTQEALRFQLPHQSPLGYNEMLYEEENTQHAQLGFTSQNKNQSINNYFDYSSPLEIVGDQQKTAHFNAFEEAEIRKQKEKERKAIGVPKKPKQDLGYSKNQNQGKKYQNLNEKKPPKSKQPAEWNDDVKTKGVFDPNLRKDVVKTDNFNKRASSAAAKKKAQSGTKKGQNSNNKNNVSDNPYKEIKSFADIRAIEDEIAKSNNNTLTSVNKNHKNKLMDLQTQYQKEQEKTRKQNQEFAERIAELRNQQDQQKKLLQKVKSRNDQILSKTKPQNEPPNLKTPSQMQKNRPTGDTMNMLQSHNQRQYDNEDEEEEDPFGEELARMKEFYEQRDKDYGERVRSSSQKSPTRPPIQAEDISAKQEYLKSILKQKRMKGPKPVDGRINTTNLLELAGLKPPSNNYANTLRVQQDHRPRNLIKMNNEAIQRERDLMAAQKYENQLKNMRSELLPLMNRINQQGVNRGPVAELLESSVGRLIKIHSEKVIDLLVDDLLIEIVAILNYSEEVKERQLRQKEVVGLAHTMLQQINDLNRYQNQIEEACDQSKRIQGQRMMADTANLDRKPFFDMSPIDQMIYEMKPQERTKFDPSTNKFIDLQGQKKVFVQMDPEMLIKALKDQYMLENHVLESNYKTLSYTKATQVAQELILMDVYDEVFQEFNDVQNQFINKVIQNEFDLEDLQEKNY